MNKQDLISSLSSSGLKGIFNKVWFAVSSEKDPDLFTRAIQKFQGTKYSHALVIYYSADIMDFVIANAHGHASQLDTIDQFYGIGDEVDILYEAEIDDNLRSEFARKVIELDGIDYSEQQIFNIGVDYLFGCRIKPNGIDGVICSEYADRLFQAAGFKSASVLLGKPIDLLSPKDNIKAWEMTVLSHDNFRKVF